ncbi:MAG: ATP-binding cassette domain-containing protein [Bacteroidetes bacterium]|nr:ATP-binding cassette domain-containing protein [Bacteroidota bacterium]
MNLLSIEHLSKSFGSKELFRDLSFGIEQGQKVALIARNGAGKTTLLRILQGKEIPDSGEVVFGKDLRVGFLEQDPTFVPGDSVYDSLFRSDSPQLQAIQAYELALDRYERKQDHDSQLALQEAMQYVDEEQAWDFESQIRQILGRLNINDLDQDASTLSGGQKKRVALARLLIENPQLLILDEPTNHLDIEMIEWLEAYFERNDISLLLVTHDRHFLDQVCTDILELDRFQLFRYKGNYEYYLEKKAEREFNEERETDKAKNLFKKELEWVRRQPKARGTKSKSRLQDFDLLKEKVKSGKRQEELELNFKMNRLGGKVIELHHIHKAYGEKKIISDFSHVFKKGERIGVVGKNGVGKSTLLNILTGNEKVDAGKVIHGETLVVGYYSQEGLSLPEDMRVIDVVKEIGNGIPMKDGSVLNAVQLLKMFQFPPDVQHGFVSKLSGGERKRLFLLTILMENPNFLILDEPTNDLDLMTLGVLEDFLSNFPGCLIIVSHDRYFMDRLTDQLFVFEGDGRIRGFIGNYGDYRMLREIEDNLKKVESASIRQNDPDVRNEKSEGSDGRRKLSYKESRELEELNQRIPELEARKKRLESDLLAYSADHEKLTMLGKEMEVLLDQLDEAEMRWLELNEFGADI